jgi:hypothetical protein
MHIKPETLYINEWMDQVGPLPENVRVTFGLKQAQKVLGKEKVTQLAAMQRFRGGRPKARAQFDGYVVPHEGEFVVTCPDPKLLPRTGWRNEAVFHQCQYHVNYLRQHDTTWTPERPRYDVSEWDWELPHASILSVDVEGVDGDIRRFSVCNGNQTLTDSWNPRSRDFLRSLIIEGGYETFLAHNAEFDKRALQVSAKLQPNLDCTMAMHQSVFPWRANAIGKCAQLYVPGLAPWKHKEGKDEEEYSLWDAGVCWEMGVRLLTHLKVFHLECHYKNVRDKQRFIGQRGGMFGINGYPGFEAKAAGLIHMDDPSIPSAGVIVRIPWEQVMGYLTGKPWKLDHVNEHTRRLAMGWGIRQARNGCKEIAPEPVDHPTPEKLMKSLKADMLRQTNWEQWRKRISTQANADGFIKGVDQQRAYGVGGGEGMRFQYWSAIAALQSTAIAMGAVWVGERSVIFTDDATAAKFQQEMHNVLVP